MIRVTFVCLFLSTAASADVSDSCFRAFGILTEKAAHYVVAPFSPKKFALKQKIMRRFSQLGGHRIHGIEKSYSLDRSDYLKGLANLGLALEDADPIWNQIKLNSIFITESSSISIHLNTVGLPYASIPYDTVAHSLVLNLSIELLEFGIRRKLKKNWPFIKNKGLAGNKYQNALQAFYNALEKGPIPEELGKLRDVIITRKGDISYDPSTRVRGEEGLMADLYVPAHAVEDLEGIAVGVLESEVGARLFKDYTYISHYRYIGNAVVNDGVERKTYREVLKKMIKKLTEGPTIDLKNLAHIHITKGGGEVSVRQRGDGLFDFYLPAEIILNDAPLALPSSLP